MFHPCRVLSNCHAMPWGTHQRTCFNFRTCDTSPVDKERLYFTFLSARWCKGVKHCQWLSFLQRDKSNFSTDIREGNKTEYFFQWLAGLFFSSHHWTLHVYEEFQEKVKIKHDLKCDSHRSGFSLLCDHAGKALPCLASLLRCSAWPQPSPSQQDINRKKLSKCTAHCWSVLTLLHSMET